MRQMIRLLRLAMAGLAVLLHPLDELRSEPLPADVRRIVVLGDSITYSGQYVAFLEAYARRQWPEREFEFLNLGLPSETVSGLSEPGHADGRFPRPDLHERLDRVLRKTQPDLVLACYGMNCGIYHPYAEDRFQAWQDGMRRLHQKVLDAGARIIHITPPVFDPQPILNRTWPPGRDVYAQPYRNYNEVLDLYSAWLLAQRGLGWEVIDAHGPMNRLLADRRTSDPDFKLAGDGVHIDDRGHWLMTREILLHFREDISNLPADTPADSWKHLSLPDDYVELIRKKQRLLSDAWLNEAGHQRPGMNRGLPVSAAEEQAAQLNRAIDSYLAGTQPNIVIILADDLGYGDIQAFQEQSTIPTPHLNRLAAEGMRFTDAHSGSAVCTPTRYGLLTGRYCWRTELKRGVLGGYSPPLLEPGRPTIASLLKKSGYRTGAIGKWHLGMAMPLKDQAADLQKWEGDIGVDFAGVITDGPLQHGFDYYFGVSASLDMAPYVYVRNDRFTQVPARQQIAEPFPHFIRTGPRAEDFVVDKVLDKLVQEAVAFLEDSSRQPNTPFFLYLPLTAPHKPTQPHARFRGQTGLGEYGDFVAQVDWSVGQVLEALRQIGAEDETLVIFSSDNGSYMHRFHNNRQDHVDNPKIQGYRADRHRANGPWRGTKADIWEAGHRVPFIARWPGQVTPGSVSGRTVCLTDIYATCAEIVGASLEEKEAEDSESLLDALRGSDAPRGVPVVHHSVNGTFAIRDGPWKLVLSDGSGGREKPAGRPFQQPYQLFDLSSDPGETNDLADEHPGEVERFTRLLEKLRKSGRSVATRQ